MPTNAYAQYDFAGGATNASSANTYYEIAQGATNAKEAHEYYDLNGLDAIERKVEWFGTANAEAFWEPGLIWNGCDFVRYSMWNGSCWQTSQSTVVTPDTPFPTSVVSGKWSNNNANAFVDLPAFPVGMTSAVALVATMRYGEIALPAGWTLLGTTMVGTSPTVPGGSGQIRKAYAVAINNPTGTESLRFNFSNEIGDSYNMKSYSYAYFVGGQTNGSWQAIKGPEYINTTYGGFATIPSTAFPKLWWQTGIVTAVYTSWVTTALDHSGGQNGFMETWTTPAAGSASGENFRTRYLAGHPATASDYIDTDGIGAYGQPNSTSWGFLWTPPTTC